ncbi:hypothetical protein [Aquisalinus flavus]|uniref:Uncharacterized protein n=1 Tax=Aquisalinus flavus TaxID=1526572 RepID=A0A8J2Y4T9_9PROT|nr:hypothetical protein [Aquisalinus flavus]MBD0427621.1 hypothetical protein [Aquisalinus flavus]UNE47408.1 hypothetical protein FF099_04700 [Aquisalinus flavus]GGD02452.1 hypothetical protein GCM10011342_09350 [Aquisalinus flavus]
MLPKHSLPPLKWRTLEKEAQGLIYGAILVLSLLMAIEAYSGRPFRPALILFGSVLAMALARALAALISNGLETGERLFRVSALRAAWTGSHPVLFASLLPSGLMLASSFGWLSLENAILTSQLYCILVLVIFGARVGWVIGHGPLLPIAGAFFAGGVGVLLAVMKYILH